MSIVKAETLPLKEMSHIAVFFKPVLGDFQTVYVFALSQFPWSWEGAKIFKTVLWGSLKTALRDTDILYRTQNAWLKCIY